MSKSSEWSFRLGPLWFRMAVRNLVDEPARSLDLAEQPGRLPPAGDPLEVGRIRMVEDPEPAQPEDPSK
jgi:hypothetical protein